MPLHAATCGNMCVNALDCGAPSPRALTCTIWSAQFLLQQPLRTPSEPSNAQGASAEACCVHGVGGAAFRMGTNVPTSDPVV